MSEGRSDKKFCCEKCRNNFNNHKKSLENTFRMQANRMLDKNYSILKELSARGIRSISLQAAIELGFNKNYATSVVHRKTYLEYSCFGISYRISESRIFNIHQLELYLRNHKLQK